MKRKGREIIRASFFLIRMRIPTSISTREIMKVGSSVIVPTRLGLGIKRIE